LISILEKQGRLERELEALPSDEELAERETAHTGLTRPEIAVMLAYSKIKLYEELLASDIHKDPDLSAELQDYFPKTLHKHFATQLKDHSLCREITATHITNSIINRMGSTYCARLQEDLGATAADITRAYTTAKRVFGIEALWETIESLDTKTATQFQVEMIGETRRLLERSTRWLLRNRQRPLNISNTIKQFDQQVSTIKEQLLDLLHNETRNKLQTHIENLKRVLVPDDLARQIAILDPLLSALDIGEVARQTKMDITLVAESYFEIDLALDIHWLHEHIAQLPRQNHWHRSIRGLLRDDLNRAQRALTAQILSLTSKEVKLNKRIEGWLNEHQYNVARYRDVVGELKAASKVDMSMLTVAVRGLRNLAGVGIGEISPGSS
jgi:glutamate dehydrogenase